MKKLFLLTVSLVLCNMAYAGGSGHVEECNWNEVKVKTKECPVCPKVKCPKAKTTEVVKWKTRLKTKYVNVPVEKVVYKNVDNTKPLPTHTFGILGGLGPDGVVTDYYDTEDRSNEYVFRTGRGTVFGLQYQYRFTSSLSVSATALSNYTYLGGIHFSK